jgi:hypothetical protein
VELVPVPFQSTDIIMIGYDPNTYQMQIQFKNGSLYSYDGIEPDTYNQITGSGNGNYFHEVIKPQRYKYPFTRLI